MTVWVVLLRGINVGGRNRLPMKDLTAALEAIGCANVKTYIQSGNAVFSKPGRKAPELARLVADTIAERHGLAPAVILLTARELENAVRANPFPTAESDPKSLHVSFLAEEPTSPNCDDLNEIKSESESFALRGSTFYLHAPDGIGRSKLAARAEKLLGVSATARNWRTVTTLLELTKRN